jgi:hypothetical protein
MIKSYLKKIIPLHARQKIRKIKYRLFGFESSYKHLSTEQVFETIYQNGIWGKNEKGLSTSGSGSHTDSVVSPYIDSIKKVADDYSLKSAVDLGCGDFAVGSKLFDMFERYTACDISSTILDRNKTLYKQKNLEFKKINLAEDELPIGDIAFVRQVLQHLSNREIAAFVKKLNLTKPYKYIVITEHLPFSSDFMPNLDKPSGPNTRIALGSGVILHAPPFQLNFQEKHEICNVEESTDETKAVIKSVLYVL